MILLYIIEGEDYCFGEIFLVFGGFFYLFRGEVDLRGELGEGIVCVWFSFFLVFIIKFVVCIDGVFWFVLLVGCEFGGFEFFVGKVCGFLILFVID